MPLKKIYKIPSLVLKIAVILLLVFGLVGVALTKTQVGRNIVRDNLEQQFNQRFKGSIEIESLTGNLIFDIKAKNVRLYDPSKKLVIATHSITLTPDLWDLFQNKITIKSLALYEPKIYLHRSIAGIWNIEEALKNRTTLVSPQTTTPPTFNGTQIALHDGFVRVINEGKLPKLIEENDLYDFTNTTLREVNTNFSLSISQGNIFADLLALSCSFENGLKIVGLTGQFRKEENQINLSHLDLQTEQSNFLASGKVANIELFKTPFSIENWQPASLDFDIEQAHFDENEIKKIFPKSALPSFEIRTKLDGKLSQLYLRELELRQNENLTYLEGVIALDTDSLSFNFDKTLLQANLGSLATIPALRVLNNYSHLKKLTYDGAMEGSFAFDSNKIRIKNTFTLDETQLGEMSGTLALQSMPNSPTSFDAVISTKGFDLGYLLQNESIATNLSGDTHIWGKASSLEDAKASLTANFYNSGFDSYELDSLELDIEIANRIATGTGYLAQKEGAVQVNGQINFVNAKNPQYILLLKTRDFDLHPYLKEIKHSTLNSFITLNGEGFSAADFNGAVTVAFRPSVLEINQNRIEIPELTSKFSIHESENNGTQVQFTSDFIEASIDSELELDALAMTGQYWINAFIRTIAKETDKSIENNVLNRSFELNQIRIEQEQNSLTNRLARYGQRATFETRATASILNPELLNQLFPNLPQIQTNASIDWFSKANAVDGEVTLGIKADSLRLGSNFVGPFALNLEATSLYDYTLEKQLNANLVFSADTAYFASQSLKKPTIEFFYQHRGSQLFATAEKLGLDSKLQLWANLDLMEDKNRLTIVDFTFDNDTYAWSIAKDQIIDLYKDGISFQNVIIERTDSQASIPHRFIANGILSENEQHEVSLKTENILLNDLSQIFKIRHPIGGLLNASFTWKGSFTKPIFGGVFNIQDVTLQEKNLGDISSAITYIPSQKNLAIDLHCFQNNPTNSNTVFNDFTASGFIDLPGGTNPDGTSNNGFIDMGLDIRSLDLFFFDILFPSELDNSSGRAKGTANITGTFAKPYFDASLNFVDTKFDIPAFNLTYSLEGDLKVDREGFHLLKMNLNDKTGGSALVQGDILFNDYRFFSFDLEASMNNLQIMDVSDSKTLYWYGNIWSSGVAQLKGPLNNAFLTGENIRTSPNSVLYIPITGSTISKDDTFIIYADSTGEIPEQSERDNILGSRPQGERTFLDGLEMLVNIDAPSGSTVNLVFDPLLGDVIHAVGNGDIQIEYVGGNFQVFGDFNVERGDYLFTVQDLLFRRKFLLDAGGKMTWNGDPINALLNIPASYRTRASTAGLESVLPTISSSGRIALNVQMNITGDVNTPIVDLKLTVEESQRTPLAENIETFLNQNERAALYASSVLLTNSFLLATALENNANSDLSTSGRQLVYNSLSQVVASFLNRVVSQVLTNVDVNLGIHQGINPEDLALAGGVSFSLLDDRLIIRGQGIIDTSNQVSNELLGELVIEVKLSSNLTGQVFIKNDNDILGLNETIGGLGVIYQRSFSSWGELIRPMEQFPISSDSTSSALE